MAIPVVNLADFTRRSGIEKSFCKPIKGACEEVGFVAVKNYGILDD